MAARKTFNFYFTLDIGGRVYSKLHGLLRSSMLSFVLRDRRRGT